MQCDLILMLEHTLCTARYFDDVSDVFSIWNTKEVLKLKLYSVTQISVAVGNVHKKTQDRESNTGSYS